MITELNSPLKGFTPKTFPDLQCLGKYKNKSSVVDKKILIRSNQDYIHRQHSLGERLDLNIRLLFEYHRQRYNINAEIKFGRRYADHNCFSLLSGKSSFPTGLGYFKFYRFLSNHYFKWMLDLRTNKVNSTIHLPNFVRISLNFFNPVHSHSPDEFLPTPGFTSRPIRDKNDVRTPIEVQITKCGKSAFLERTL